MEETRTGGKGHAAGGVVTMATGWRKAIVSDGSTPTTFTLNRCRRID